MASPEPALSPVLSPSSSPSPAPSPSLSPSLSLSPLALADGKLPSSSHLHARSAFENLPDEIIQQILQLTDPNSFASLVFLNSRWRRISQQAHLYAHHLMQCHSYATSHPPILVTTISDDDLPRLRRLFAREVKRNLFEAYLRPKKTTIKLISNSSSSSSAPGGEGMQFSFSPRGHHLLAYNSSRIYVLDLRGASLVVKRELKILRRPVSACIIDDGSFLAVLSTDMQIDLYDLGQTPPRRRQSIVLDNTPRAIALTPCGTVLAAAYEGGIEVSSVSPGALPTERRAVKCDGVDALAFSLDGTQLLGTTTTSPTPSTVILTAPYFDPGGLLTNDNISALWTTSILFPNASRDCTFAALVQESSSMEATWTFTYDKSFETFRAVRIDDLRNGTTYFTGPVPTPFSPGPLLPSTLPAGNYQGELVSAGFHGSHIWLYGVPENLEAVPEVNSNTTESSASPPLNCRSSSGHITRPPSGLHSADGLRVPQWQILCDKQRNNFISGHMITESAGVSNVKWVFAFGKSSLQERLVIAAKGIAPHRLITEEEGIDFLDGGRVTMLDFDYGLENGLEEEVTIEVGTIDPEILEEEHRDIDTEVAIVRRRTVAQRRGRQSGLLRAATISRQAEALLRLPSDEDMEDPLVPRRMMTAPLVSRASDSDLLDDESADEVQEALDAPYTHASPRSGTTLRRAATAAAVNRQRNPPPPAAGRIEYRRADGRAEHPHESDADNWVPPPPPYSKDDPVVDLPSYLRYSFMPGPDFAAHHPNTENMPLYLDDMPALVSASASITPTANRSELPRIRTSDLDGPARRGSRGRSMSQPITSGLSQREDRAALTSNAPIQQRPGGDVDVDDIYEASPLQTPSPEGPQSSGSEWVSEVSPERERPSTGAHTVSREHTPLSSRSLRFGEGMNSGSSPPTSVTNPVRREEHTGYHDYAEIPVVGQLPNASTWPIIPGAPLDPSGSSLSDYSPSESATYMNSKQSTATGLPIRGRPEQAMALEDRRDNTDTRLPVNDTIRFSRIATRGQRPPSPPEQPLIISTLTGITGAFDEPRPNIVSNAEAPVLHAPVPRHPRPSPGNPLNQPTAERLETITNNTNNNASARAESRPSRGNNRYSIFRHRTSVSRRPSRARRSALKNLQDARGRGWTGHHKKTNSSNSNNNRSCGDSGGHATGTGTGITRSWTDIPSADSWPTKTRGKLCVVM
ncbi:hypothetical protein GGR50DRAFT_649022 [Xylaria sp. CBS 124048]|nr:hypothetical protein GGR50DRAFT_649022 [Xylaria sp. CBS 124048]